MKKIISIFLLASLCLSSETFASGQSCQEIFSPGFHIRAQVTVLRELARLRLAIEDAQARGSYAAVQALSRHYSQAYLNAKFHRIKVDALPRFIEKERRFRQTDVTNQEDAARAVVPHEAELKPWTRSGELDIGKASQVSFLRFDATGSRVAVAVGERVLILDTATGERVAMLEGHSGHVTSVAFSHDGRLIATTQDRAVRIWNADGAEIKSLPANDLAWSVDFNRSGTQLLVSAGPAIIYDVATWEPTLTLRRHDLPPGVVNDFTMMGMGAPIPPPEKLSGHTEAVVRAEFSPDGRHVLTASRDKTARLWDASTGETVHVFTSHTDAVTGASFSPDGKFIVTASWDQTAKVWDAETFEQVAALQGHTGRIDAVAFSSDGKKILTSSRDKTVREWAAATGEALFEPVAHQDVVTALAVHPSKARMITGSRDGHAYIWDK